LAIHSKNTKRYNRHEKSGVEYREAQQRVGQIGEFIDVTEEEFFNVVTKNKHAVCHFNHKDFNRCKISEHHLKKIAYDHPECKFLQIDVDKCPFLCEKLLVVVLPTICMFRDGIKVDEINGFDEFGGKDEFETVAMTRRYFLGTRFFNE
jgi:thioredoxin-like negative regulator of GroEL